MDFVFDLTIPANTSASDPVEQVIDVGVGIVHLVEIGFPRRCVGLAHVAIRQGLHQVWPTNPDGNYAWDNHVYSLREHYGIAPGDPSLVLQGWNEDDTFQHTITFRFSVLPVEVLEWWEMLETLMRQLLYSLGV